VPRRQPPLERRDKLLLVAFLPVWLVCWGLTARSIGGGSGYPGVTVTPAHGPDAYPVVMGFLPWVSAEPFGIRVGDPLIRLGQEDLRGGGHRGVFVLLTRPAPGARRAPVVFEHAGERRETVVPLGSIAEAWPTLPGSLAFVVVAVLLLVRARPPTRVTRATAASFLATGLYLAADFIEPPAAINASILIHALAAGLLGPLVMRAMFEFFSGDAAPAGRLRRSVPGYSRSLAHSSWLDGSSAGGTSCQRRSSPRERSSTAPS
jgi:hypothetical protein